MVQLHVCMPVTLGASRLRLKCDGTRAETRFSLSAKRTSSFKSAGASVKPTAGSRGVRISGSNAGYTMFQGSVKSTGYRFHSPVSPSLPLSCVTVCHYISTGLRKYNSIHDRRRRCRRCLVSAISKPLHSLCAHCAGGISQSNTWTC
jgi:hypothetical protein